MLDSITPHLSNRAAPADTLNETFFPWIRALAPSLRYLAFDAMDGGEDVLADFRVWLAMRGERGPEHYLAWVPQLRGLRHPELGSAEIGCWSAERRACLELFEPCNASHVGMDAEEVVRLSELLPSLRGLSWSWSFTNPADFLLVINALPGSLNYLVIDVRAAGFELSHSP